MPSLSFARSLLVSSLIACSLPAAGGEWAPRPRPVRHTQLGWPTSGPLALGEVARLPEWAQVQRITDGIRGDAEALDLLRELPLLAGKYADPSYFLDFIGKWRDRIPDLATQADAPAALDSSWVVLDNGGNRTLYATFPGPGSADSLTVMRIGWSGGQVADLNFFAGFGHALPLKRQHRRDREGPYRLPAR